MDRSRHRQTVLGDRHEAGKGSSLSGKVLANAGIPVRGASVTAYALDRATFHAVGSLEATTTTDSEGRYELSALNPGPKEIHVAVSDTR